MNPYRWADRECALMEKARMITKMELAIGQELIALRNERDWQVSYDSWEDYVEKRIKALCRLSGESINRIMVATEIRNAIIVKGVVIPELTSLHYYYLAKLAPNGYTNFNWNALAVIWPRAMFKVQGKVLPTASQLADTITEWLNEQAALDAMCADKSKAF